jgi:hypothetical protein
MGKGIPYGFYQGNRSEYYAIPALSKLGFTVPVPRQEDQFGIDFIVHLAYMKDGIVVPSGKSFGIQIKSTIDPISFDKQENRDCLFNSNMPFFIGVVNRKSLNLTIYHTLARLRLFWMKGPDFKFDLVFKDTNVAQEPPDYQSKQVHTGKPILKIGLTEPGNSDDNLGEFQNLQSTMEDWIKLENENLSLKEQKVPLVFLPTTYETNKPFPVGLPLICIKYAALGSLPDICKATAKNLVSLGYYLEVCKKINLPSDLLGLITEQYDDVEKVKKKNLEILNKVFNPKMGQ